MNGSTNDCLNYVYNTFNEFQSDRIVPSMNDSITRDTLPSICKSLHLQQNRTNTAFANAYINTESKISFGELFYGYFTPVIIVVGLVGNTLSLSVFMSKAMRNLSASLYLTFLSISDMLVLIIYVFFDWLSRGTPYLPGNMSVQVIHMDGVCHAFLYLSYTMRFVSVWLIVGFTIERYIGICWPLKRITVCTRGYAKRSILMYILLGMTLSIYKPLLSGVYNVSEYFSMKRCTHKPESKFTSFVMDVTFGIFITVVPFFIICILNCLMTRRLFMRRGSNRFRRIAHEHQIRLEFTLILLGVSTCFIALNLPYFVVWCFQMYRSYTVSLDYAHNFRQTRELLLITRTIFYLNYCINFFLYSITGACFRKELKALFQNYNLRNHDTLSMKTSRASFREKSSAQSWV